MRALSFSCAVAGVAGERLVLPFSAGRGRSPRNLNTRWTLDSVQGHHRRPSVGSLRHLARGP